MWPLSSSTSYANRSRDSSDRYLLLPSNEPNSWSSVSSNNSNSQSGSPPCSTDIDHSQKDEWDSSFPSSEPLDSNGNDQFQYQSSSSRCSSSCLTSSLISLIKTTASKLKRSPLYFKLLLLSLSLFLSYHSISILFFKSSHSTSITTLFEDPRQAVSLLESLSTISNSPQDTTHRIFKDNNPGASSLRVVPLKTHESISDECLEAWVSRGEWETGSGCGIQASSLEAVHAVVNGSDVMQVAARQLYRPGSPLNMDSSHRYGDHNELLYSMRSFRSSLKKGKEIWVKNGNKDKRPSIGKGSDFGLEKMHILASAYPLDYQRELIEASLDLDLEDEKSGVASGVAVIQEPTPSDLIERSQLAIEAQKDGVMEIGVGALGKGRTLVGQVPWWLKSSTTRGEGIEIEVHHDSEYFAPLPSHPNQKLSDEEVEQWREKVIPTFNSLAVESQIYNLPTTSTSTDAIVYFNDDFFTLLPSSVADYTSPLYGTVLKSLPRITSMYWPSENPIWRLWNPSGEEVGIKRAAWVLAQRFSSRPLPYITHHPRSLSLPLLREAAQTFPEAFGNTALARFRAQQDVPVSSQAVFLGSWYIVQRHREALLWSWAVAKWGSWDGKIDQVKRDQMWNELTRFHQTNEKNPSDDVNPASSFSVKLPTRSPLSESSQASLKKAGLQPSMNTQYDFSSQDGYALSYLDHLWWWQRSSRNGLPDLSPNYLSKSKTNLCDLKKAQLGSEGKIEDASEFFKRIAFQDSEIGDCFIPALIAASGRKGVESFLPSAGSWIPNEVLEEVELELKQKNSIGNGNEWELEVEHLPITPDWHSTEFSLGTVIKPKIQTSSSSAFQEHDSHSFAGAASTSISLNNRRFQRSRSLRAWTVRLIHRYSYVLGTAESELYQMKWTGKVENRLKDLDEKEGRYSQVENWLDSESTTIETSHQQLSIKNEKKNKDFKPLTFLALNDDLKENDKTEVLNGILAKWFQGRWGGEEYRMPDERLAIEL